MNWLPLISTAVVAAGTIRQSFVLSAIVRSRQFLRQGQQAPPAPAMHQDVPVTFFIVIPVLREAALLREAVTHFHALAYEHSATVLIVTTARETAEAPQHAAAGDTVAVARKLASEGTCVHVHYPDPLGVKGDQLNYAAACCAGMLPVGTPPSQAFLVCYDADSRPPQDSLVGFAQAITGNAAADVFHQSARFEFRPPQPLARSWRRWFQRVVCDAGALRANRFVLGFEIPRLRNRSAQASALKRILCSGVYAHVTGHGLCIRLSLLDQIPFPARSPLEDMHYSFILGSRGLPMIAVPSLDAAEVPTTITAQLQQAARWFFGPARFARYLNDPAVRPGWRARIMAASAFGSAAEWIGCALVSVLLGVLIATGPPAVKIAALCYTAICALQVVLTETTLGTPAPTRVRLARMVAFPLACAVHGAGGIIGAARLLAGGSGAGKTERGPQP